MKYFILLLILTTFSLSLSSQTTYSEKKQLAKEYFYYGKYKNALGLFSNLQKKNKKDQEVFFLMGICQYQLNHLDKALANFNLLLEKEKKPYPECWLYLAKIFHARHQFGEAAHHYKLYLKTIKDSNPKRKIVIEDIKRCANGIELQYRKALAIVENMGAEVNSSYDEFSPVLSPNHGEKLYFSSIRPGNMGGARNQFGARDENLGDFFSDMFSCQISNGSWGKVQPMHYLLNSPRHDVLLDFNNDGSALYYFKGWSLDNGEFLVDTFRLAEDRTLSSDPYLGPVNAFSGDKHAYFVNDTLVFFSSKRLEGFGGMDIYKSSWRNGRWSTAQNLGPVINSPFDESHPFLALDQRTLYFSSNNSDRSIGGLDIFKSIFVQEANSWTTPFHLGIPINSASDDTGIRLAKDGFTAFFESSRKDGLGQRDLYIAYFNDFLKEQEPPSYVYVLPPESFEHEAPPTQYPHEGPLRVETSRPYKDRYDFPPVLFNHEKQLTSDFQEDLNKVAMVLKDFPELHLVLSIYSTQGLNQSEKLFNGIKKAEMAKLLILKEDFATSNIFTRAYAVDRPGNFEEKSSNYTMEFSFLETRGLAVEGKLPVIGQGYQSLFSDLPINQDLFYKIQVSSIKGPCRNTLIKGKSDAMVEESSKTGYYRYTLGAFSTFREAKDYLKRLKRGQNYHDAFIVPYINGKRANQTTVKRNLGIYPDLENYRKGN